MADQNLKIYLIGIKIGTGGGGGAKSLITNLFSVSKFKMAGTLWGRKSKFTSWCRGQFWKMFMSTQWQDTLINVCDRGLVNIDRRKV